MNDTVMQHTTLMVLKDKLKIPYPNAGIANHFTASSIAILNVYVFEQLKARLWHTSQVPRTASFCLH